MLIRLDICINDGSAFGGAVVVSNVVRVGAVTFVTTVTTIITLTPGNIFLMRDDGYTLSIRYSFVECVFCRTACCRQGHDKKGEVM